MYQHIPAPVDSEAFHLAFYGGAVYCFAGIGAVAEIVALTRAFLECSLVPITPNEAHKYLAPKQNSPGSSRKSKPGTAGLLPIVSLDGKKRELVGNFKYGGRTWRHKERYVNDHDFHSDASGVALPFGICDVRRNAGLMMIGTSHETAAFAVDTLEYWWRHKGKKHYPGVQELLILADGGGANSSRSTVWKCDLQQKICNRHGLKVTVCHHPLGASKWNPIEHRLFSEISKHRQGVPLKSYDTILNYIRRTKTTTGLSVTATLNAKTYQKGENATPEHLDLLNFRTLHPHPEWNYTICAITGED